MAASTEPGNLTVLPDKPSAKHSLSDNIPQDSRKTSRANEDILQQDVSSCTPGRFASTEIHGQGSLLASIGPSSYGPDHPSYRMSLEHRQHHYHPDVSDFARTNMLRFSTSQTLHQATNAHEPGLASPPGALGNHSAMSQTPVSCVPGATPCQWGHAYPGSNQPFQGCFPPYVQHVYFPTDRMHTNPPADVPFAELPRYISTIDDVKVRDVLAIAVVRHRDIHDMVEREYERRRKEVQDQLNEDASVLSFSKEHTKVQMILYTEYDDFSNSKRQEIVHRAIGMINQISTAIPSRVRPRSNWKTKFNAFLTLVWIGRGIIDGIGMLPNDIRTQMAIDSKLVDAIKDVYGTMSEDEILADGSRLVEALVNLNKDRESCFEGLEKIVEMFKEVMRQGSMENE